MHIHVDLIRNEAQWVSFSLFFSAASVHHATGDVSDAAQTLPAPVVSVSMRICKSIQKRERERERELTASKTCTSGMFFLQFFF